MWGWNPNFERTWDEVFLRNCGNCPHWHNFSCTRAQNLLVPIHAIVKTVVRRWSPAARRHGIAPFHRRTRHVDQLVRLPTTALVKRVSWLLHYWIGWILRFKGWNKPSQFSSADILQVQNYVTNPACNAFITEVT